eukprot:3170570-Pleurochrysis_carterae.AAC.1
MYPKRVESGGGGSCMCCSRVDLRCKRALASVMMQLDVRVCACAHFRGCARASVRDGARAHARAHARVGVRARLVGARARLVGARA